MDLISGYSAVSVKLQDHNVMLCTLHFEGKKPLHRGTFLSETPFSPVKCTHALNRVAAMPLFEFLSCPLLPLLNGALFLLIPHTS